MVKSLNLHSFRLVLLCLVSPIAMALPTVDSIVQGSASIDQLNGSLNIQQQTDYLHIRFQHLNVGADESVNFQQPSLQSLAIAESLQQDPTQIYGSLTANGQLLVVSPSGLVVHEGGTIEAFNLGVATTAVTMEGVTTGQGSGALINHGSIRGQRTLLLGESIENYGQMIGVENLNLSLGDEAVLLTTPNGFAVSLSASDVGGIISNHGVLESSGSIMLDARQEATLHQTAIHNIGSIKAHKVEERDGEVWLLGGQGDVESLGELKASNVQIESNRIHHAGSILAQKVNGAGGRAELVAEEVVVLSSESRIDASASLYGDGGFVRVFSPKTALFKQDAYIFAEAGSAAGNGGYVDVSGWEHIEIFGRVSTAAINGESGIFLIDPYNVTISASADNNVGFGSNIYTPSSSGAIINVSTLESNLQSGNVQVVTTGAGAESGDISVSVGIDLDGTNGNTLHLLADGSIQINGDILDSNTGTADLTNIILETKTGSITGGNTVKTGGGDLSLVTNGNVTLGTGGTVNLANYDAEGGSLTVESKTGSITLVSDIDLDGMNGQSLNLVASTNLALDFDVYDSATGTADAVDLFFQAKTGTVSFGVAKYASSYGGNLTIQYDTADMDFGVGGDFGSSNLLYLGSGKLQLETLAGDLTVSSFVQLDGRNGGITQLTSAGNLNINDDIIDSTPGTVDLTFITLQASNNLTMLDGVTVNTSGGTMSLTASNNLSIANAITGGGDLFITAGNDVLDSGDAGTSYDINTSGGIAYFSVNGDIGGSSWATALEVADTHFDFAMGNPNSNVYLDAGLSTAELEIVGLDYNGGNGLNFNMRSTNGADIRVSGRMEDSNNSGDAASFNLITQTINGDIIIEDAAAIRSKGGTIDLSAGNSIALAEVWSAGGAITITAANLSDSGDSGGSDINVGGGVATLNLSGDVGTSFATAIDLNFGTFDINNSGTNQTHYFSAQSPQDVIFRNVDFNGVGTYSFNFEKFGSGDVVFSGDFHDSDTATSAGDTANISIISNEADGHVQFLASSDMRTRTGNISVTTLDTAADIIYADGANLNTNGGTVTLNSAGDITVTGISTNTGTISLTAVNIIDGGDSSADLSPVGGTITINASGNVGGASEVSGIEIRDATLNLTASGTNQNAFLNGVNANDVIINNVEYDGTGSFNFGVTHNGTGDIQIAGAITDSAAGTTDVATLSFETTTGNIVGVDGATIRSYGGDITYNSAGQLGIVRTKTDGGQLNITATEVYDNGNTGPDIETLGGEIVFNVLGDIGVSGNGSLELRDSIVTGAVGSNNVTWDFRAYAATNYNSIGNIDIDGGDGFNLVLHNNSGGQINVVGSVLDSNTATADSATISLQTLVAGDDIVMDQGVMLNSYGGSITLVSADAIGMAQLVSGGGNITVTSAGNIYDNNTTGSEFYSSGGIVTINLGGDIGGSSFSSALEIRDSILDLNYSQPNQNVWLNAGAADGYVNVRNVDFNDGDGGSFNLQGQNGSDIIVSGQMYDSDAGVQDNFDVNLVTLSATSDITINSGASIATGTGVVTLDSANNLYLTGLNGASITNLSAVADIYDNGDATQDIQTTGVVNMTAGGSVGVLGANQTLDVTGGTYNITMGAGDWDIAGFGALTINDIEINGALGSQLKVVASSDLFVTGVMTDSVDSGDRIHLILGTSSPGFIVVPDSGYTVLGTLEFWAGTTGVRDGTDERVSLVADELIISGNSFLGNTGNIVMDLSVDRLDITHLPANKIFEINNDKSLEIVALDGDNTALSGQGFFFDINGDLIVPNTGLTGVEDEIRVTANNITDSDADNVVTIQDSTGDADAELRLYVDITGASTLQINTDATVFDGSSVTGSELTVNYGSLGLDLSQDIDGNGSTYSGSGRLVLSGASTVTLSDAGLQTLGDLWFLAGDVLDSDGDLSISANNLQFSLSSPSLQSYTLNTMIDGFGGGGFNQLVLNNGGDLVLSDLNSDGNVFSSISDVAITNAGILSFPESGVSVSGDMRVVANDLTDGVDGLIAVSADRMYVELTSPTGSDYGFTGSINQVNTGIAANVSVVSSVDLDVIDWSGAGNIMGGAGLLELNSSGVLTIPSSGLSAGSQLTLIGQSVTDGDFNLQNLNAPQVKLASDQSGEIVSLSGTFTNLDVSLSGSGTGLVVNQSQSLSLLDLDGDGNSLAIKDGYAYLSTQAGLSLSDNISIADISNDGQATGFLLAEYVGVATVSGATILLDSQLNSSGTSLLGMDANRLLMRQVGAASASNSFAINGSNISVLGGDVTFDITANTSNPAGYGSIQVSTDSVIRSLNALGEGVATLPPYDGLALEGTLQVGQGRNIVFQGYTLESDVPEIVEPDIEDQVDQSVSDAINDSVQDPVQETADNIQEETVSAVEDSPNVNFALNEMFSDCREGNERDAKCKVKEEISRFLGRFLIGGSMPKTVR